MTFAPNQAARLRGWNLIRTILFWVLMIVLALVWRAMRNGGQGTRLDRAVGYAPLRALFVLFLFVLAMEKLKRKRQYQT